jgi:hypothetical protein
MGIVQRYIAGRIGRMVPTLRRIATSHMGVDTRDRQPSKTKWVVRRLCCDKQGAHLARVRVIIIFSTLEPVRTYSSDPAPRVFSTFGTTTNIRSSRRVATSYAWCRQETSQTQRYHRVLGVQFSLRTRISRTMTY